MAAGVPCSPFRSATPHSTASRARRFPLQMIFNCSIFDGNHCSNLDGSGHAVISPNLYRVQKLTSGDYYFRHHLETTVENSEKLKDIAWKRIGPSGLIGAVKVRIDNLGRILAVGEYD